MRIVDVDAERADIFAEQAEPAVEIGQDHVDARSLRHEGLVVAQNGETVLDRLIAHIDQRELRHLAAVGRAQRGGGEDRALLLRQRLGREHAGGGTLLNSADHVVGVFCHWSSPFISY